VHDDAVFQNLVFLLDSVLRGRQQGRDSLMPELWHRAGPRPSSVLTKHQLNVFRRILAFCDLMVDYIQSYCTMG